jgi:1-acyl-sn-glycerol-3-phosphate acyltransferase
VKPLDYFFDTSASGEDRYPQRFCSFFLVLIKIAFTPLFRYRSLDRKHVLNLPPGQAAILAANHRSYLDPLFIMSELRPHPIRFMGKEEFFQIHPAISRMAAWVGTYPVKRNTSDMSAVKRSIRMLKRGELVGIFPEGTRIRFAGQIPVHHQGVALIAQVTDVPVIPIRIWGTERICPEGKRFFRTPKVSLRFGEPLRISDEPFASMPKDQRNEAFTEEVMRRIYDLEPLPGTPEATNVQTPVFSPPSPGAE